MIQADRHSPKPTSKPEKRLRTLVAHPARLLRFLGPGLVTGAADDDPSGIATYSQIGAQFGFAMLWTLVLSCEWRITDFRHKSAIRHTQVVVELLAKQ